VGTYLSVKNGMVYFEIPQEWFRRNTPVELITLRDEYYSDPEYKDRENTCDHCIMATMCSLVYDY
jgi:hypothetical protein